MSEPDAHCMISFHGNMIIFNNKTLLFWQAQAKTLVVSMPFNFPLCFIRNVQTQTRQCVTVVRPLCLRQFSFQRALLIDTIYNTNVIAPLRAHFTRIWRVNFTVELLAMEILDKNPAEFSLNTKVENEF